MLRAMSITKQPRSPLGLFTQPKAPVSPEGHAEQHVLRIKEPSRQTPYMVMSVQANEAPKLHNLLAAIYS